MPDYSAYDARLKHLEMVQAVIARMAQNNFTYRGWALTLITGLYALAKDIPTATLASIALTLIVFFWWLDGYYLRQERLFRALYAELLNVQTQVPPYSLNTDLVQSKVDSFKNTFFSTSVFPLYLILLIIGIIIMVTRICCGKPPIGS